MKVALAALTLFCAAAIVRGQQTVQPPTPDEPIAGEWQLNPGFGPFCTAETRVYNLTVGGRVLAPSDVAQNGWPQGQVEGNLDLRVTLHWTYFANYLNVWLQSPKLWAAIEQRSFYNGKVLYSQPSAKLYLTDNQLKLFYNIEGIRPGQQALILLRFEGQDLAALQQGLARDINTPEELADAYAGLDWVNVNSEFCFGSPCLVSPSDSLPRDGGVGGLFWSQKPKCQT